MAENVIRVVLNQQQLELLDATIERGIATDRVVANSACTAGICCSSWSKHCKASEGTRQ